MPGNGSSKYRWYILTLSLLTYGIIAGTQRMCMPVLFKEISGDLGLSMVEIGLIWGMDPLAGVFIGLPAGLLADRFGIKRMLVVVSLGAGIFSALRGLSVNFFSMAAFMFLFGLMAATTPNIVPKATTIWFRGKYLGLTNALIYISSGIGSMMGTMLSATVLSPALGGWRNVLFFWGAPAIIISLLWIITGREPQKSELSTAVVSAVPFRQAFSHVVRIREIWFIGLALMCQWGTNVGVNGYLPLYLRNIGWSPTLADSGITILSGVSMAGAIPMVLLSDRLGSRKKVLAASLVTSAVSLVLLPMTSGSATWMLLVIIGVVRSGVSALTNVLVFEMRGVGSAYAGTAMGLAHSISMMGSFFSPPIGNSLSSISPGLPFVFWAFMAALALPCLFFIKERRPGEGETEQVAGNVHH